MDVKLPPGWRARATQDIGTLWIMRHGEHRARCALIAGTGDGWELRVIVDGQLVLSESCPRGQAAFVLAQEWEAKLTAVGWRRIAPSLRSALTSSIQRLRPVHSATVSMPDEFAPRPVN